jgi:superfamily II RNA helicase
VTDTYKGLRLDRFQRESFAAIDAGENVIVAAPTGAGKTLIAEYAIEQAMAAGKRAIYTAPIKALSNQKYRDLGELYPGKVGISTGDVSLNPGAPIVVMTTEIFRNAIFEDVDRWADVGYVIFDEVHYLDDPERGTVWEESLIFAPPHVRVLALSATVSNLDEFSQWVGVVRDAPTRVVLETHRPVPLTVRVASTEGDVRPLHQVRTLRLGKQQYNRMRSRRKRDVRGYYQGARKRLVEYVAGRKELPLLFFLYSRAACADLASACANLNLLPSRRASKGARAEFLRLAHAFELDTTDPECRELERLVGKGIAYHHAGLLPPFKEVIERLFSAGHIRLLCATETFALGVNMPARSVAFEGLRRWNGTTYVPLKTREFQQMAGRAGRRGIDDHGTVYVTFDPYRDEPGVVTSLVEGNVEPVRSQFNLSYGTLLNLYQRLGEDIYEACERSFANFKPAPGSSAAPSNQPLPRRRRGRKGERGGRGRRGGRSERTKKTNSAKRYAQVVEQVRLKLGILAELGYLDSDGQVTEQGRFAMSVFGHELEVTELVYSGLLQRLTPVQVALVAVAVVHESRPNVFYGGPPPRKLMGKDAVRLAQRVVTNLVALEEERGVKVPSKLLDWNLSAPAHAWAQGAEFADLRELTDASDGDLVRTFRQAIQVLRLCQGPLKDVGRHKEAGKMQAALGMLKRGLIDAEWQLKKASEVDDPDPSDESPSDPEGEPLPEAAPAHVAEPVDEGPAHEPYDEDGFAAGIL